MLTPVVLLDVDGVISNLIQAMIDYFKSHPVHSDKFLEHTHDNHLTYKHHLELGITDADFWDATNSSDTWWLDVEPYDYAHKLVNSLRELLYPNDGLLVFCTSPSLDVRCASQKVGWLRKHGFLSSNSNNYQIGPHKHLNAGSGAILIDDYIENIKKFTAAGYYDREIELLVPGRAILFPQPYNTNIKAKTGDEKVAYVIEEVKRFLPN